VTGARRFRRLFRLPARNAHDAEREIDDEIAAHLALRADSLETHGMTRDDAEHEAARMFGDLERARRTLYAGAKSRENRMRLRDWLSSVWQDMRYAARQMHRRRAFTAAVSLTLALGIGANAAMFGAVDRLLFRAPAGVARPETVARLYFTRTYSWAGTVTGAYSSYGDYIALRGGLRDIAGIAVYGTFEASMGRGAQARLVQRTLATPSLFSLLGVRPALGRFFDEREERVPIGDPVAVLSYGFWQREFGADARVIGRTIELGARRYQIVGVAPRDFTGVDLQPSDVWVPFSAAASELGGDDWYRPGVWTGPNILVRLRREADRPQIAAHATAIYRHTLDETERTSAARGARSSGDVAGAASSDTTARVDLGSLIAGRAPPGARASNPRIAAWLSTMAFIVLLIACGNVINLLLASAAGRRREIAVRLALGAARKRLMRQLAVESTLLVMLGGVLGIGVGALGDLLVRRLLLPAGAASGPFLDRRLLLFTLLVTTVVALITGVLPSIAASRSELTRALKSSTRDGTYRRSPTRDAMLLVQAALSVVLLVGAGLFIRSLRTVLAVDLGFDARRVAMATIDFSNTSFSKSEIEAFYRTAAERVRQLPGVDATALTTSIPFGWSYGAHLVVPGRSRLPITKDGGPYLVQVTPDYFATAGTRIVRGRGFSSADRAGSARVAVVSETMARLIWPGDDALGKCIKIGSDTVPCTNVVGVARDTRRQELGAIPVMQYYLPLDQHQFRMGDLSLIARTRTRPASLLSPIRQTMIAILPDLPYVDALPLQSMIDPRIQPWRIGAGIFVAFGVLALVIASLGLYAVVAYEVAQRTQEFGIRAALGATRDRIVSLVLRRGLSIALIGVVLGAAIARIGARWIEPLLFETSAADPGVFALVGATLLVVALAACVIPARRAASSDPATALRCE
jgi:predicted permease